MNFTAQMDVAKNIELIRHNISTNCCSNLKKNVRFLAVIW